jgi:FkbM family methyltransferase
MRTVVDCGANIGLTSLYFASRYPTATIYAIEPHPANYELLRSNVATQPRIVPVWGCVVGRTDRACYISTDRPAWGNSVNQHGQGESVPAMTLESFRQRYAVGRIDLLKVDIEGAEEEVFARPTFLPRTELVIIELHGRYDLNRFQHDIAPYQFRAVGPDLATGNRMVIARPQRKEGAP